jgi:hypothetical protein
VGGSGKKKVYRNSKKRSNLTKIIGRGAISKTAFFQPTLMYVQEIELSTAYKKKKSFYLSKKIICRKKSYALDSAGRKTKKSQ